MKYKISHVLLFTLFAISSIAAVSCSCFMPSLNLPSDVHLSCSPDVQITEQRLRCVKLAGGDTQCTLDGKIENKGNGTAKNVRVNVDWTSQSDAVGWNPSPLGDLQPSGKADFEAIFNGYYTPDRYDIYVNCDSYE
jgi:uncharacterized membrane protein